MSFRLKELVQPGIHYMHNANSCFRFFLFFYVGELIETFLPKVSITPILLCLFMFNILILHLPKTGLFLVKTLISWLQFDRFQQNKILSPMYLDILSETGNYEINARKTISKTAVSCSHIWLM